MINLMGSVTFFALIMILLLLYLFALPFLAWFLFSCLYLIWRSYLHIFKWFSKKEVIRITFDSPLAWFGGLRQKMFDRRFLLFAIIFIFVFNLQFYLRQRAEWMGEDNANLQAKEYFVAGQVLYLYRSVLTKVVHPDNIFLLPMNQLQELIYNVGSKHLPENDGEIGIWMDTWMVYPYSKKFRLPKGYARYTNDGEIAPMLVKFLDRSWFAIKNAATKPFADQQMYEQHYLRNFAGMAHFYAYQNRGYAPGNTGASFYLSKIPMHMHRSEQLIVWLEELKDRWDKHLKINEFLSVNPVVEVMRQVGMAIEFHRIILGRIHENEFTCDDPYLSKYFQTRLEFVNGESGKEPAIQRMKDRVTTKRFTYVVRQSVAAKFDSYILEKYCGIKLPGKVDWTRERRTSPDNFTLMEAINRSLNVIYDDELKKLEEQFNGN